MPSHSGLSDSLETMSITLYPILGLLPMAYGIFIQELSDVHNCQHQQTNGSVRSLSSPLLGGQQPLHEATHGLITSIHEGADKGPPDQLIINKLCLALLQPSHRSPQGVSQMAFLYRAGWHYMSWRHCPGLPGTPTPYMVCMVLMEKAVSLLIPVVIKRGSGVPIS